MRYGGLAATGGRPGEKVYEILERRAADIWADWIEEV